MNHQPIGGGGSRLACSVIQSCSGAGIRDSYPRPSHRLANLQRQIQRYGPSPPRNLVSQTKLNRFHSILKDFRVR